MKKSTFMNEIEQYYINNNKNRIRARKRKQRAELGADEKKAADKALYNNFLLSGFADKYESFFVYNSVNTEADTKAVISYLKDIGKKVYLPRVVGRQMEAVPLGDKFIKGAFGIEEPFGKAYDGEIDAAIIPAFAFDLCGNRVGYGGGYYDRYLLKHPNMYRIVFGYDFQLTSPIAVTPYDVPAQYIITDKRYRPVMEFVDFNTVALRGGNAKKTQKKKEKRYETEDN